MHEIYSPHLKKFNHEQHYIGINYYHYPAQL